MGATITDAILQAGLNYDSVVRRRTQRILDSYPQARTTSEFLKTLEESGPKAVLDWKDDEKPRRVLAVTQLFIREGIETELQLETWLDRSENIKKLQTIKGIKKKTTDYFRKLVGIETCAPDVHLYGFIQDAQIILGEHQYEEAKEIINRAAVLLGHKPGIFDQSIWEYKSGRVKKSCED